MASQQSANRGLTREQSGPRFAPWILFLSLAIPAQAIRPTEYLAPAPAKGAFPLAANKTAASIYVDSNDYPGVIRAAKDLQSDIAKVTGITPALVQDPKRLPKTAVIIGAIGKSPIIDALIKSNKLDAAGVAGRWEAFVIQVVPQPLPGVASALVIAGADKRGTIYGIYDLSAEIGVSPWYWWADVPVRHKDALFIKPGRYSEGSPAVKYRGIFLNDEAPCLSGWAREKFGTLDHRFYEKVFELILRMKGNFLWPAMWDNAFNEDDPLNPKLADEYGIVMSTSHHEPMMRAQQEWKRHGKGPWDYTRNADFLREFWREGVRRNRNWESIITLGMRGDGDMPMSRDANVALLEKIVADQRKIISEEVNPNLAAVPQVWALYKEVQDYYEKGMRVPDDVTLLWSDDNWGDVRRLPTPEERKRAGGAGIYYHFDYVGGPRSYKWINTVPITKVWEQMTLSYRYGADRIWIVNVGDLKPMEFPIEFFLDLARNPDAWPKEKLAEYTRLWCERQFGSQYAAQIADILAKYTKYNGRRKPELLEPDTYSLTNYQEADRVLAAFKAIAAEAESIAKKLPADARDAFFELILYPAKASEIVNDLYITTAKNRLYAAQGRASANDFAVRARELFQADSDLADYYNRKLANGKWNHMMDQTHIGYTYWNQPRVNRMPEVKEIQLPADAQMGIDPHTLPTFDVFTQRREYVDVFNRGQAPFEFTAAARAPWIVLSATRGTVEKEKRIWLSVDWMKAPRGSAEGIVTISQVGGPSVEVPVKAFNPAEPSRESLQGFAESNGYVSIDAVHYTKKIDTPAARWEPVPDYGRTDSSMTLFPMTAPSVTPPQASPCLEYQMYLFDTGKATVEAIIAPTLNFVPGRGLRFAVSFDDQPPQIIDALADNANPAWEKSVSDSVRKLKSTHAIAAPGYHTLKFWMVDPGVVLQKLVIDLGGLQPSYLGPPESYSAKPRD